ELVVQLAGDLLERALAGGDDLLRELAALVAKRREAREEPAVRTNQVQPGRRDDDERRGEEQIDAPLHGDVDVLYFLRRLVLGLVVLHEQPRDGRAERCLPRLERQPDLGARVLFAAVRCQREDAVRRGPELRDGILEILPLLWRPARDGDLLFAPE